MRTYTIEHLYGTGNTNLLVFPIETLLGNYHLLYLLQFQWLILHLVMLFLLTRLYFDLSFEKNGDQHTRKAFTTTSSVSVNHYRD